MLAALQGVVFFPLDCEKGEGPAIAERYGIRGYPTYIAMNGKGDVTDRWIGYEGADLWSASVLAAQADPRTLVDKMAAFEIEPTLPLALSLANSASTASDFRAAVDYYQIATELDPASAKDYQTQILSNMIYGLEGGAFTMDEVVAMAGPVMASDDTTVDEKLELAMLMKYMAGKSGQMDQAVPFIKTAYEASADVTDETALKYRNYLAVDYILLVEQDPDKALGVYRSRFPEGWTEDPEKLNEFAWWCFENNINLEEAQAMAMKGIELAENDAERANIMDTAAEICNALGNCDEAVALMQTAVELDPQREYFQEQLVRFQKAVEEKGQG